MQKTKAEGHIKQWKCTFVPKRYLYSGGIVCFFKLEQPTLTKTFGWTLARTFLISLYIIFTFALLLHYMNP